MNAEDIKKTINKIIFTQVTTKQWQLLVGKLLLRRQVTVTKPSASQGNGWRQQSLRQWLDTFSVNLHPMTALCSQTLTAARILQNHCRSTKVSSAGTWSITRRQYDKTTAPSELSLQSWGHISLLLSTALNGFHKHFDLFITHFVRKKIAS